MSIKKRDEFIKNLKHNEGVVLEVYLDHLQLPTVGCGHLILESDPEHGKPLGTPITEERCNELLHRDLKKVEQDIYILFPNFSKFHWRIQHLLCDMIFNLGRTRLSKFKNMIAAVERDDIPGAIREIKNSRYYKQVTNRADRNIASIENLSSIYE